MKRVIKFLIIELLIKNNSIKEGSFLDEQI